MIAVETVRWSRRCIVLDRTTSKFATVEMFCNTTSVSYASSNIIAVPSDKVDHIVHMLKLASIK